MHRLGPGLPGYLILFAPPAFSLSVSCVPDARLRLRCSAGYQRISPLHPAFRHPIPHSSPAVPRALPGLSPGISHAAYGAAYAPFTPSKSEQRPPPLYYRGCWHRVSRGFLLGYHQVPPLLAAVPFSPMTGVYDPRASILHAASLCQAFAHCKRSSTAASRRSLGSVSVPMRLVVLSDQLTVSHGGPLPRRLADGARTPPPGTGLAPGLQRPRDASRATHPVSAPLSGCCPDRGDRLFTCSSPFRRSHPPGIATRGNPARLACLIHAASVRSEPESNSHRNPNPFRLLGPSGSSLTKICPAQAYTYRLPIRMSPASPPGRKSPRGLAADDSRSAGTRHGPLSKDPSPAASVVPFGIPSVAK